MGGEVEDRGRRGGVTVLEIFDDDGFDGDAGGTGGGGDGGDCEEVTTRNFRRRSGVVEE